MFLINVKLIIFRRFYINQQWQFFKKLGVPHDPPSIRGLGNMAKLMEDKDNVSILISNQVLLT